MRSKRRKEPVKAEAMMMAAARITAPALGSPR